MLLVLKVAAGVVLALLLLVLLLVWWFKRWVRRIAGRAMDAAACLDPHQTRPARIQLVPAAADRVPTAALAAAWDAWHRLGLQPLGDFEARPLDFPGVRAAAQAEPPLALALWAGDPEAAGDAGDATAAPGRSGFVLFALLERNRLLALTNDPDDTPLDTAGVRWIVEPGMHPAAALQRMARELHGQVSRPIDATLWRTVFERAWAARMDADIAQPPSRSAFDARLAARPEPVPPATADQAFELTLSHWRDQVSEAALDQFRRASRIDAVRWETLREDVHVVHEHLDDDTVIGWLADGEPERQLGAQLVQQGLHGTALYEGLDSRRPAALRREKLGSVSRPLPATIYGPPAAAAAQMQPQAALRDHVYEAVDAQGATVHGAVMAHDSGDARRQLQAMGLDRARVLIDPVGVGVPEPYMLDPAFAAAKARAMSRGLAASVGVALLGNAWLWLPPLLWAGWSWWQGPPFGWGGWLSFVVAALALGALAVLVLPMVLYHELQRARLFARWGRARICLAGLRRLNLLRAITPDQLLAEELKIQSGSGQLRQALARWAQRLPHLPAHEYHLVRSTVHDAAGDHAGVIEAQRAWRDASPSKDMPSVDLALSLARYGGPAAIDEAEALLAGVKADDLSELARGGYCYAQGVLLAARGQPSAASHQYQLAQRQLATFRNNPLMHGLLSEIGGHHALALRATGDSSAQALWDSVLPVLRAQPGPHPLLAAWAKGAG